MRKGGRSGWAALLGLALASLVAAVPGRAQECVDYRDFFCWTEDYYGTQLSAQELLVSGNLGFAACGMSGLRILDLADPDQPVTLSEFGYASTVRPEHLAYQAPYLYSIGEGRFWIIDVSDPSAPVLCGSVVGLLAYDISVARNLVFLSGQGIFVIDVADPLHPAVIAHYQTEEEEYSFAYGQTAIRGGWLYATYDYPGDPGEGDISSGLVRLDFSDPRDIQEVERLHLEVSGCQGLAFMGSLAAVFASPGFHMVETAGPSGMQTLSHYYDGGSGFRRGIVDGTTLYVRKHGAPTLEAFDCSDPGGPVRLGGLMPFGAVRGLTSLAGRILAACDRSGFLAIAPNDFAALAPLGELALPGELGRPVAAADQVYAPSTARLFEVVDVSQPGAPVALASGPEGAASTVCELAGSSLVCATGTGIRVVDVSNPAAPVTGPYLNVFDTVNDIACRGDYAFLACTDLRIAEIANPLEPHLVTSLPPQLWLKSLTLAGDLLYARSSAGRLFVIDVAVPTQPQLLGSYDSEYESRDFAVAGDRGYFLMDYRIEVLDLADPSAPTFLRWIYSLGDIPSQQPFSHLWIAGDLLLVTGGQTLSLFDVSAPDAPRPLAAGFHGVGGEYTTAASTCLAYTDGTGTLRTLPLPCELPTDTPPPPVPAGAPAIASWPNPFNPLATIRFTLHERGPVELSVHTVDGRLVRRLAAEWREAGVHELHWDGCDDAGRPQAAGSYLARLRSTQGEASTKLVLLK